VGGLPLDPILEKPQGQKADPALHELAKVLDFGIAKLKEAHIEDSKLRHMTLTGTGMVVGTPAYMSPEQARGMKGDQLDGRSDLYSLGVVMYQMLCGDLPLNADSVIGLLMAHIQTEPPPIRARRPDVPEPIARLVMSCLEKKPELRPSTGQALMEEIERWEEEPARRAREKAEAERRAAEEKAEQESQARLLAAAESWERQDAERERKTREAEAAARAKAEKERRRAEEQRLAREKAERERQAAEAERVKATPQQTSRPNRERSTQHFAEAIALGGGCNRARARSAFPRDRQGQREGWFEVCVDSTRQF